MLEDINPPSKRLKRTGSPGSSSSNTESGSDALSLEIRIPPSETEVGYNDDYGIDNNSSAEDYLPSTQTDLETALLPIKTDNEAIANYEISKAQEIKIEKGAKSLQRYEERHWVKGKSSIYVDAFNLALENVLEDEAHLFDETEMAVFNHWRGLPYESQYLYVRLFLRKTSAWHRVNRLGYYQDIADMPATVEDLRQSRKLPISFPPPQSSILTALKSPDEVVLGEMFQFAEGLEQINTLEEASSLLLLDELKSLSKEAKVQGKNKKELLKGLRESSTTQSGLGWPLRYKPDDGASSDIDPNQISNLLSRGNTRDLYFTKKILDHTGDCIRLSSAPLRLFERVHLLFYRSTEWTEKSLTTIILAKISRRNYPNYIVSRSNSIFPSRFALLEFEAALRVQFDIDSTLESPNMPIMEKLALIKSSAESVYERWKALVAEEQRKEERVYETGEGAYLRRFSPAWVYTRIIHKGLYALGRFKEYKREHELLTELLDQRLFHSSRRGAWYQRKALLEEHYMWSLTPSENRSEEMQRREWKRKALRTCEGGLEDPDCHLIYHYDLQKRITKLEKSLKVTKREQHDFGHVMLVKPEERIVEGIRIEKDIPIKPGSKNNISSISRRGRPTVWVDEREGGGECRVESMCLSWYRDNGWKGFHCESGIVRTLFGYLFYDVLFTYVPNVFQTPFQTCPLDLHTDSFYPTRASEINHRLAQIANGDAEKLIREVHDREAEKETCAIGIDWSFNLSDLVEIAQCFRGEALATVCKVMAQEYQQRGGGIPDLFLWSVERKEVMFVEVKSENDRLSDTQRLWIHVLTGAGVRVELCNAVAREVRVETPVI
ncbi:coiled-coil domain-containing protein MTMR15 [Blastomyces gilchristii SLH14081]|uniref:Fanconi-associated nuclease n=1 Tax=Blastomyces gilchristii (strain SLH14081) TaxID=559298 RepID=A0A179UP14_BLAGS|nr:coiled-coil domain-containing protein MTMR15 [Blastomyces gilchristii SLH14081]OAT08968.1 coiled-coil domain-containing protein MTMR15 [Blastomyces gilchristii SLH14081]